VIMIDLLVVWLIKREHQKIIDIAKKKRNIM